MKFFFIMVASANGKISRSEESPIDWNSKSDLKWFKEITMEIGTVVMGRKTFEMIGHPLSERINVVMSNSILSQKDDDLLIVGGGPKAVVKMLENINVKNVAVIGGRSVFTSFMKEGLVDEMYVTYEPIFIDGIDMFDLNEDVKLKNLEIKGLESGAFVVHYAVKYGRKDERI